MRILIVASFIPYPPDSGGRIRTWEIAMRLKQINDVTFAFHVRSRDDLQRAEMVRRYGFKVITGWVNRGAVAIYKGLQEIFCGGVPLFALRSSYELERRLADIQESDPFDVIQIEHFELARYAQLVGGTAWVVRSIVLHDVLSVAYARMAKVEDKLFWRTWLRYNSWRLAHAEQTLVADYDVSIVVSEHDRHLILSLATRSATIQMLPNCVDSREKRFLKECMTGSATLLFVGLFLHPPNADGAKWMVEEIFPRVQAVYPKCCLRLVGADPTEKLKLLKNSDKPGIEYVGYVADVETFYEECDVVVVPLRSGGGTRLKILEAMAFGRAVVSTTLGAEGLDVEDGKHLVLADDAHSFANAILELLHNQELKKRLCTNARKLVEEKYDWDEYVALLVTTYRKLFADKQAMLR